MLKAPQDFFHLATNQKLWVFSACSLTASPKTAENMSPQQPLENTQIITADGLTAMLQSSFSFQWSRSANSPLGITELILETAKKQTDLPKAFKG